MGFWTNNTMSRSSNFCTLLSRGSRIKQRLDIRNKNEDSEQNDDSNIALPKFTLHISGDSNTNQIVTKSPSRDLGSFHHSYKESALNSTVISFSDCDSNFLASNKKLRYSKKLIGKQKSLFIVDNLLD